MVREKFKPDLPQRKTVDLYLGLRQADRTVDAEYPEALEGALDYLCDVVFFCNVACTDLMAYGEALRARHGRRLPPLRRVDFTAARARGAIPPDSKYGEWLKGFKTVADLPPSMRIQGFLQRLWARWSLRPWR